MKRFLFSIQLKLFLFISLLVTLTLAIYLTIALGLFNKDKTAYIYGTSLSAVEALESQVEAQLNSASETASLIWRLSKSNGKQSALSANSDTVFFAVYKMGEHPQQLYRSVNSDFFSREGYSLKSLYAFDFSKLIATVQTDKDVLTNMARFKLPPLLAIVHPVPQEGIALLSLMRVDKLNSSFSANEVYMSYLITGDGVALAHKNVDAVRRASNLLNKQSYLGDVLAAEAPSGVKEVNSSTGTRLVAYSRFQHSNATLISEIDKEKAFAINRELTRRSVLFGIFVLSVALLVGTFFARTLTAPIRKLVAGTLAIGSGDFSSEVHVTSRDELGILAAAFNHMARRILVLLDHEKKKIALEKELEVAKLVQDNFFPTEVINNGKMELVGVFQPSALCGGDWWNAIPLGDKTLFFVGDATGHGVSSALVTAAAASVRAVVMELQSLDPTLCSSPARFLQIMNRAIYRNTSGSVLMTFFAVVVDPKEKTLTYVNASHNPPLLYRRTQGKGKKFLVPLNQNVGSSLGLNETVEFENVSVTFDEGDILLAYTDGLIECTNTEAKEWGKRNLIDSYLEFGDGTAKEVCENLLKRAKDFFGSEAPKDDITVVVATL